MRISGRNSAELALWNVSLTIGVPPPADNRLISKQPA